MSKLLTIADVADLLSVSTSTVRRMVADRQLSHVRIRGSIRFDRKQLVRDLAMQTAMIIQELRQREAAVAEEAAE